MSEINRLKESLDLCEEENDKARRIILWCAERLKPDEVRTIAKMVREGITPNTEEDYRADLLRVLKAVEKLTKHFEQGAGSKGYPQALWWYKPTPMPRNSDPPCRTLICLRPCTKSGRTSSNENPFRLHGPHGLARPWGIAGRPRHPRGALVRHAP